MIDAAPAPQEGAEVSGFGGLGSGGETVEIDDAGHFLGRDRGAECDGGTAAEELERS
jgi:hypothetical protein